jgi:hypothetical protein
MNTNNSSHPDELASRAAWWGIAVLLLTTVHHVYGASVYRTPWRLHVAPVSAAAAAAMIGALRIIRRPAATGIARVAFWTFAGVTFLLPVVGIGLFEGGYNHVLKNALYFGGASPTLMRHLFPPPTYEMPNDAFFEVTGMMQAILGGFTGSALYRLMQVAAPAAGVSSRI